jgi:hypothetical protein
MKIDATLTIGYEESEPETFIPEILDRLTLRLVKQLERARIAAALKVARMRKFPR